MSRFTHSGRDGVSQITYGGPSSRSELVPSSNEIKRDLSLVFYAWLEPKRFEHNLRLEHNLARGRAGGWLPQLPLIENKHGDGQQRIRSRVSRDSLSEFIGADRKNPVGRAGYDAWYEHPFVTNSEND